MSTRSHLSLTVLLSGLLMVMVIAAGEYADRRARRILLEEIYRLESSSRTWKQAREAYEHLLALDPANAAVALRFGKFLSKQGDAAKALATYEFALTFAPDNPDLWEQKGAALWALISFEKMHDTESGASHPVMASDTALTRHKLAKRFDEVLFAYRQAIKLDPQRTFYYRDLINHAEVMNRVSDALALYQDAQRVMPDSAWVWCDYGGYLQHQTGRKEEGMACVDKAITLDSTRWQSWAAKAVALGNANRIDEALQAWDMAIAVNKDDPSLRSWHRGMKGDLLHRAGRLKEAEDVFLYEGTADGRDENAWYQLAGVRFELKRPPRNVLTPLDSAVARAKRMGKRYWQAWQLKGEVLAGEQRDDEALVALDTALAMEEHNRGHLPHNKAILPAWTDKAQILEKRRQLDDALKYLDTALIISPQNVWTWNRKAEILKRLNRGDEARTAKDKATYFSKLVAERREAGQTVAESVHKMDSALSAIPSATRQDSIRVHRQSNLELRRSQAPKLAHAIRDIEKFLVKDPKTKNEWWGNAYNYDLSNRLPEAEVAYTHVIELDPQGIWGWRERASVRARLGKRDAAIDDLAKALQLAPEQRSRAEADPELESLWGDPRFEKLVGGE